MGGDQQQQQQQEQKPAEESNPFASNPFAASSGSTPFSFSATAFVPQGVNIVTEEEFPDLDSAFSKPQKKKQPTPDELKRKQEEENAALPTKGKPSSFF